MEADNSTRQLPPPEVTAATTPNKRPHEADELSPMKAIKKRQKQDTASEQDAPPEVKAGESSKAAEKRPSERKHKESRKSARDRREAEKAVGKRRGTRPEGESPPQTEESGSKAPRLPKRMSAMLIGFCGAGYNGMQIQKDAKTIEGTLFDALVKAGAVSEDNADAATKVSLNRAARTDAGVHAAGNLVSLKLITRVPGVPDILARINEELPPEIRVWQIARVQNSFNARSMCDSRKYTYYFPSYLLLPPKPGSGLQKTLAEQVNSDPAPHPFWSEIPADSSPAEDLLRKRHWRATPEHIEALREIVQKYEGSHNFHNFTVGREFSDRSASRFMKKIEVSDPTVHGETEWISVSLHGQSFMLHQIRKMIAAVILVCRTGTPPSIIEELYGPRMLFVPKMPALGLLLEYPIFQSYNKKIEQFTTLDPESNDYRAAIDFEALKEQLEAFKQEFIYSRMRSIEDRDGIFDAWIRSVDHYTGHDLLYLNPKGIIPTNAVIKRNERREKPFREKRRFDATSFPVGKQPAIDVEDEEDEEEEEEKLDKKALLEMEG
ncbi:hypothetical protein EIP86_004612 [Pleurotus ostreatoroseus]|nr:hypothetical protein EIP86_004612 [Pleurotus ostreatoroseus]